MTRADAGKEEEEEEEKEEEEGFILCLDGKACEACLRASSDDPSAPCLSPLSSARLD